MGNILDSLKRAVAYFIFWILRTPMCVRCGVLPAADMTVTITPRDEQGNDLAEPVTEPLSVCEDCLRDDILQMIACGVVDKDRVKFYDDEDDGDERD